MCIKYNVTTFLLFHFNKYYFIDDNFDDNFIREPELYSPLLIESNPESEISILIWSYVCADHPKQNKF